MSGHPQRLPDYLNHILEAIVRIERYTAGMDQAAVVGNDMAQDAVIRNFEVIGEASRNIERNPPDFAEAHPELPLAIAYEMRNALPHGYFKIDLTLVWRTLEADLPPLKRNVEALVQRQPGSHGT